MKGIVENNETVSSYSSYTVLFVLIGVIVFFGLIGWLMFRPANKIVQKQVTPVNLIMRGDEVTILQTMGARTVKDFNEMINLLSVNDMKGITVMVATGQVLGFEANTKGLVLEAPYGKKRVRILEGVHEYKDCWIQDKYIKK